MKMIYLANARIPTEKAHGLQIMKMAEAFIRQGIELELVVAKRVNNQLENFNPFDYYGLKNRFLIKKLWLLDLVDLGKSLKGLSVIIQNTTFAFSAFFYLIFKKTDWIYSRDEFSIFFLAFFKKNLVLELHNFPESKLSLYRFIFKHVKKIVVITDELKNLVADLGISKNKILVSPDGVDLEQFDFKVEKDDCRKRIGLDLEKKIILYTGHLFVWKGVYTLAATSQFLSSQELIVFVGGMEYDQKKLKKFIDEKNLKNILFIDHQAPTEIPYYLKAADILILPNSGQKVISTHYTSPMKLFEYMAANKPIVASDLPSIREILSPNESVLVTPDNPLALADGIKKVLTNRGLSEKIAQAAFNKVKVYDWQIRAKNILNFIN